MFSFFKKSYLFNKNIEPRCIYCKQSKQLNETHSSCKKVGIVSNAHSCKKFKYEPLKRIPPKPAKVSMRFDPKDFKLDD